MGLWSSGDVVPSTSPSSRASPPVYFESLRCYSGVSSATLRHSSWRPCRGFVYHHWGFGTDSLGAVPLGVWGFRLLPVRDSFSGAISIKGLAWGLPSTCSSAPSDLLPSSSGFRHLPVQRSPCRPRSSPLPHRGLSVQHQVFIGIPSGASRGAPHLRQLMVRGFQCGAQSSLVAHQGPSVWHQVLLCYLFRALSRAPCLPQGLSEAFSFHS